MLDTDHEGQLIHEINILLFIGSLYMMLKIMWMVQNVRPLLPAHSRSISGPLSVNIRSISGHFRMSQLFSSILFEEDMILIIMVLIQTHVIQ